jgi:serine/threonine-protein kinase
MHDPTSSKDAGKYRVIADLGQGGMANVYLAVARGPSGFNKLVVLKSLRTDFAVDSEFVGMFLEEARLAARLNHPHVVQTYEVADYAGRPVIVMEYLEGQTLANVDLRAKSKLTLGMRLRVLMETLEGLHHAHELTDFAGKPLGLVHRDISPQNVFITFDGHVKVLDFGIAKIVNSQVQTATGILKGKIRYMAPEQMLGSHDLDLRADLYSVGVMLWEAATGRRMWQDHSDIQVMNAVAQGALPAPREIKPDVSPTLDAICMKALAPNPADRYSTALEMANAVEAELESTETGASNRQLGQLVRETFEDVRARTRAIIEAQLLEAKSASMESGAQLIPANLVNISNRISDEPSPSHPVDTHSLGGIAPAQGIRKSRRFAAGVVAALAAVGIATMVAFAAFNHPKPATGGNDQAASAAALNKADLTPSSSTIPTAPSAAVAAPTSVTVKLSTIPADATLSLDGHPLPGNPYPAKFPLDGATHKVHAEAPGYQARTITLTPDHDTEIILALDPVRGFHAGPGRGSTPTAAPSASQAAQQTAAPKVNCHPPYLIDADGIKHFRPECLGQ